MRTLVIGLGVQGNKRAGVAGDSLRATVDPLNPAATYKNLKEVPLNDYDAAFVCTPETEKYDLLTYLLSNGKHALVEKPLLFKTNEQILKLSNLCKETHSVCYTAYNHRFEPHFSTLKALLKSKSLGKIHYARFFYGNGTARDVRNSAWRDQGAGVLPDLGSHLLDAAAYFFGTCDVERFRPISFNNFENGAYDFTSFQYSGDPALFFETSLLAWKNSFTIDVYGELGSAHIEGLCKWGPNTFSYRKRKLPSGKPEEEKTTLDQKDPTWELEFEHFKKLIESAKKTQYTSSLEKDLWINSILNTLLLKNNHM